MHKRLVYGHNYWASLIEKKIIYGSNFNLNECFHHLKIVFQTNISMSIPREKLKLRLE